MSEEFKNFREAFSKVREKTEKHRKYEIGGDWLVQDSGLMTSPYNEGHSYNSKFEGLYPKEFSDLKQYLESHFASRSDLIGIELGGRGSRLFSEFRPGLLERSLGVVLNDNRSKYRREEDAPRHHEVLSADIFSSKGKQAIAAWLGGRKPDLIFEKLEGPTGEGLSVSPHSKPEFMSAVFNRWYQLLAPGGIMLIQSPSLEISSLEQAERWLDDLKKENIHIAHKRAEYRGLPSEGSPLLGGRLYIIVEKKEGTQE